ncbi:SGNH/GDSL hydrolase family protein [Corallococcus macrosporus]|uniref:SGNH/GDSL hydrolase family protein n=1 Tax=Corallococcus macrosporus TaxID=35 RepID=A0ABS3DLF9_9BACT|nr:SGNH/GDSL hydrolase family protein [Corallococcus macrosporus]MBN8232169.1 SGNH/GDSL hydrolase family protein [Corallococcus macrosporus]
MRKLLLLPLAALFGPGTASLAEAQPSPEPPTSTEAPRASEPLGMPIRYAALGASDTVGVGSRSPASENWTARLRAALPGNTAYDRFARSGITLSEAVDVEVPRAIAFKPTLVTMWLSVNDALRPVPLPGYQKSLQATLERLMKETEARVVLLNVPDLATLAGPRASPEMRVRLREQVKAWNAAISSTARAFGPRVLVVDLLPASRSLAGHAEWLSSDGFHPSPAGYQQLADVTLEAMRGAGWLPPAPR